MANEEFEQIQTVADDLFRNANANVVFIVDKKGKLLAGAGNVEGLDLSKFRKAVGFLAHVDEGVRPNVHLEIVGQRVLLGVLFDSRSTLARVVSGIEKARKELGLIFESLRASGRESSIPEFTDEEVDEIFLD